MVDKIYDRHNSKFKIVPISNPNAACKLIIIFISHYCLESHLISSSWNSLLSLVSLPVSAYMHQHRGFLLDSPPYGSEFLIQEYLCPIILQVVVNCEWDDGESCRTISSDRMYLQTFSNRVTSTARKHLIKHHGTKSDTPVVIILNSECLYAQFFFSS